MFNTKMHKHHITPKCMLKHKSKEFINRPDNLVLVPYNYHIALHKWLYMLTGDLGCEIAFTLMKTGKFGITSCSKETRLKMSINAKTRKYSKETRLKMSLAKKGRPPWNKGKKLPKFAKIRTGEGNPMFGIKGQDIYNSKIWVINGSIFYSSEEASKSVGVGATTIRRWCTLNVPLCYSTGGM